MDVQLKRGLLEICVLAAMQEEDAYGYKLIRDISPCVKISESTLYPILKRLEAARCVTVYAVEHNGRLRKYYRITAAGRARIREFLQEWQDVMRIYEFIRGGTKNGQRGISEPAEPGALADEAAGAGQDRAVLPRDPGGPHGGRPE